VRIIRFPQARHNETRPARIFTDYSPIFDSVCFKSELGGPFQGGNLLAESQMGVVGKQAQFPAWTGSPEVQAVLRNSESRSVAFPAMWRLTAELSK
jgi:hypothetical protein